MTAPAPTKSRILPPVYFLAALIAMVCLHYLLPGAQLFGSPIRYLGALPVVAGLGFMLWAAFLFRRAGTTIKPFQESSALIVTGPYRVSRNPIYLAMVIILLGVGILLGSAVPFVAIPLFAVLIARRVIRWEEFALKRTFGQAYRDYGTKVRRWL